MEYRQLEYFLKICETGSISRAAAKLYISQQAPSKNIENLENSLGLPLFYRSPRGLTLTRYRFRAVVTFVAEGYETEYMHLFTADGSRNPLEGVRNDCAG